MTCWIIHRAFAGGAVRKAKHIQRHDHRRTCLYTRECVLKCLWAQWHKQPRASHSRGFPPIASPLMARGVLPVRCYHPVLFLSKQRKQKPLEPDSIIFHYDSMKPLSIVFYFKQATWILLLLCYLLVKVQLLWCCSEPFNRSHQQPDIKSAPPLILQPGICPHHRKHSSKCPDFCLKVCIHVPYTLASLSIRPAFFSHEDLCIWSGFSYRTKPVLLCVCVSER